MQTVATTIYWCIIIVGREGPMNKKNLRVYVMRSNSVFFLRETLEVL